MNRNYYTRRDVLTLIGLGAAAILLSSCASERKDFSFVQLCDTQLGMGGYEHDMEMFRKAVGRINELNPDFVVICGDLVHDRNEQSFADFKRIRDGLKVPCHCVSGNHDIGGKPTKESLGHYRNVIGEDYYSFEHNGCTFVVVNTQLWKAPVAGESAKHDAWLNETLGNAAKKNSPVFIVGHYPLFLETPDEPEEYMNLPVAKRAELLDLYEQSGVVAVLGGHAHRLIVNDYNGIQLVNGETTSKNFDKRPMGFRIWHVGETRPYRHEFISLESRQVPCPFSYPEEVDQ